MYRVVLTVGDREYTHPLTVELDPNAPRDLIATEIGEVPGEDEDHEAEVVRPNRIDD
jgi:hypothetical protein